MYISPSAFLTWKRDPVQFYLRYLAKNRPLREPATDAMLVGTVFDVIVKYYLERDLALTAKKLDLSEYSNAACLAGYHVFSVYYNSGAYETLLRTLESASNVAMETKTKRDIGGGVIIGGYPDLSYTSKEGVNVILDFKVNGYYSKYNKSPAKGWMKLRHQVDGKWETKTHHKDVIPRSMGDVIYNAAYGLETSYRDWGIQLSFYGWMLDYTHFVTQIEQIVAKPIEGKRPTLRVASHSAISGLGFLESLREEVKLLWDIMHSDHYFRDMSKEDSQAKCSLLDVRALNADKEDTLTLTLPGVNA